MFSIQNKKLGYYQVGEKSYFTKIEALEAATLYNQFPEWNFNNEVFTSCNWLREPSTPLKELYRIRAVQIREKYDYLRIELSGGADSTTALYSFLFNNLHVDEVVFRYPLTGSKNFSNDPFNTKCENSLSEWEFAAKPLLDWISVHYPKIKITMHDYSDDMINKKFDEEHLLKSREYLQPQHSFKHDQITTVDQKKLADKNLRIGVIYGIDKPKMCIKDGKWYLYFMDLQANHGNPVDESHSNIFTEYFYWSPDLPELVVKQAHIIKNWFTLSQNKFLQHLVRWPNYSSPQRTTYEHIVKPLIYEDYDQTTFQVAKPSNNFYSEMDAWFFNNFKDTAAFNIWQSTLSHIISKIDKKYFNYEFGKPVGFVGFLSPFYLLGDAEFVSDGKNEWHRF
jgi:hypothetical protein